MGHKAALGAAAGAGGVDDGGDIATLARNEDRFAVAAKFFPALCAGKINVWWSLGNENSVEVGREVARWRGSELAPNWIFGDENACV